MKPRSRRLYRRALWRYCDCWMVIAGLPPGGVAHPVAPDFEVKDLGIAPGTHSSRTEARRRLLSGIEELRQGPGRQHTAQQSSGRQGHSEVMSTYYKKAYELATSRAAIKAFDISSEPEAMRANYGYTSLGQCSLLAGIRRFVRGLCGPTNEMMRRFTVTSAPLGVYVDSTCS